MLYAGTTAKVGIVLYVQDTASPERQLCRQGAFRRNSLDVFQIAFDERLVAANHSIQRFDIGRISII